MGVGRSLLGDFHEEMQQTVLVQTFIRNDGYKDIYSEGTAYPCLVSQKTSEIITADGKKANTSMQITLDGLVGVTEKDKITFGTKSPKILKVHRTYDLETPEDIYKIVVYT